MSFLLIFTKFLTFLWKTTKPLNSAKVNEAVARMDRHEAEQQLILWPKQSIKSGTIFTINLSFTTFMRKSAEEKSKYLNGFYETSYSQSRFVSPLNTKIFTL